MKIDLNELRDHLMSKDKTLSLINQLIEKYFKDSEDNYADKFLESWARLSLERNVERIYEHSESPIEKIFLNSLNISAFMHDPFFLIFTPKFESITEAMESFRKKDKEVKKIQKHVEKHAGIKGNKAFLDWVNNNPKIPQKDKTDIATHIIMYHDLGLRSLYHLSIQSSLQEIRVNNKHIRPDMFIWIPSNSSFKLVVECDGFDYHSKKIDFSKDRARDRLLQSKGIRVLRFSGSEIFSDPVEMSMELCDYLISQKEKKKG